MTWKKLLQQFTLLSLAIFSGIIIPHFNLQVQAHSKSTVINQSIPFHGEISQTFQPPDRGIPPKTVGGSSRGCGVYKPGEKLLTALLPENNLGLTMAESPTFFWYTPESTAQRLEFTLLDENDIEVVYKETFLAPSTSGIASLKLPAKAFPLKTGKRYHWYLAMICDPDDRTGDAVVEGWLERIKPSQTLANDLKKASVRDRPSIYAKAGIWQESLTGLAELRRKYPEDLMLLEGWEKLLNSVQLNQFSQEPIIATRKS